MQHVYCAHYLLVQARLVEPRDSVLLPTDTLLQVEVADNLQAPRLHSVERVDQSRGVVQDARFGLPVTTEGCMDGLKVSRIVV